MVAQPSLSANRKHHPGAGNKGGAGVRADTLGGTVRVTRKREGSASLGAELRRDEAGGSWAPPGMTGSPPNHSSLGGFRARASGSPLRNGSIESAHPAAHASHVVSCASRSSAGIAAAAARRNSRIMPPLTNRRPFERGARGAPSDGSRALFPFTTMLFVLAGPLSRVFFGPMLPKRPERPIDGDDDLGEGTFEWPPFAVGPRFARERPEEGVELQREAMGRRVRRDWGESEARSRLFRAGPRTRDLARTFGEHDVDGLRPVEEIFSL